MDSLMEERQKHTSQQYRDNWTKIFGKKKEEKEEEEECIAE
jgi:hypothetical protein